MSAIMSEFRTVYDFREDILVRPWILGIVAFAMAIALLIAYIWLARAGRLRDLPKTLRYDDPRAVLIVAGVLVFTGLMHTWQQLRPYQEVLQDYNMGRYSIVEGTVQVFSMQSRQQRGPSDVIEVGETRFEIRQSDSDLGYQQSIAFGGILRHGVYVRLYYISYPYSKLEQRNLILRIDQRAG